MDVRAWYQSARSELEAADLRRPEMGAADQRELEALWERYRALPVLSAALELSTAARMAAVVAQSARCLRWKLEESPPPPLTPGSPSDPSTWTAPRIPWPTIPGLPGFPRLPSFDWSLLLWVAVGVLLLSQGGRRRRDR
jgi:hypothetical protein